MIWESKYWKEPLLRMASRLRRLSSDRRLTQAQYVQIEKDIFIGFYTVRKLFETITKVSDATKTRKLQLAWHPNRKPVTWQNNHRIDELYDFGITHKEDRDLWFICGRIIHSFIFVPMLSDQGGLAGIMFTSDTDKNKRIYSLDIESVIEVFEIVGRDYPGNIEWSRDADSGKETTKVS